MGSRANSSDGWPHLPRKLAPPRLCYRPRQDGNVGSDGRVDAAQQPANAKKSADMAEICGLGIASRRSRKRQHANRRAQSSQGELEWQTKLSELTSVLRTPSSRSWKAAIRWSSP